MQAVGWGKQGPAFRLRHAKPGPGPAELNAPAPCPTPIAACLPGFGGVTCSLCAAGSFSPGGSAAAPTPACSACPGGTTTLSAGALSAGNCTGERGSHESWVLILRHGYMARQAVVAVASGFQTSKLLQHLLRCYHDRSALQSAGQASEAVRARPARLAPSLPTATRQTPRRPARPAPRASPHSLPMRPARRSAQVGTRCLPLQGCGCHRHSVCTKQGSM